MCNKKKKNETQTNKNLKPQTNDEMESALNDLETKFGGKGGNITDMRYIRLKIKTLKL